MSTANETSPDSFFTRVAEPVLRTGVRNLVRPVFSPRVPIPVQRQCLEHITRTTPAPRNVTYRKRLVADRFAIQAIPRLSGDSAILYLHGGGFIMGSPTTHKALIGQLARHCSSMVIAPDYRLAPEHPFPAALDDCVNAYRWLLKLGFAGHQITIAGDSAGGCLALTTTLRLQQDGLPLPKAVVALSPVTDLSLSQLNHTRRELMLREPWLHACIRAYSQGHSLDSPLLSPIFAQYTGLPPILIQVGNDEILLNDSRRLHERINHTGGQSVLQEYPGMWHVFQIHAGALRSANQALANIKQFIQNPLPRSLSCTPF